MRSTMSPRLPFPRRAGLLALAALLLSACAPATMRRVADPLVQPSVTPVAASEDPLLKLLAAQFALQDGDTVAAARGFVEAAALSDDRELAEQATRLALAAKDWSLASSALARWQALAPADPGVLQARAWIALGAGSDEEAIAALGALAARDDEQGWRLVAQALLNAPDKARAAKLLDALVAPRLRSTGDATLVAMSQLAFKLGDKALAGRIVQVASERFASADDAMWSARLAIDAGDRPRARAIYSAALAREPKNTRLRGAYASLLGEDGDNAGAARVLADGPQDATVLAARAAYAARAEDKALLGALYREIEADAGPRDGARLFLLGQVAELLDRRDAALAWYRDVPDDDEHAFEAQMRSALVLDQLDRTAEAIARLHRLVESAAGDAGQQRNAWLLEADILARRERQDDARRVYARALASLPDDPRLLYGRALLAVDMGDIGAAERDLRRVIELRPDDAEALNALGYTLADHHGVGDPRQQEALALIERALELKPDEPAIIDSLGWVRYRLGDLDGSLENLRRAYARQPDADIAAHLGEVLWARGQRDEARRIWDEGRRKDATNKALLETIRRLTR